MSRRFSNLPNPACGGADHTLHRRKFLQGVASASAFSLMSWGGLFSLPAFAQKAKRDQKHCILLWLCGAPSQFETWDPKPGRPTGGPFRSIPTKLPGIHFGELMPKCASIADNLAVVRSMKTNQSEHLQGIDLLNRGAAPRPPFVRPTLGAVLAQQLGHACPHRRDDRCSHAADKEDLLLVPLRHLGTPLRMYYFRSADVRRCSLNVT
jgi:hypothetical protein